MCNFIEQEGPKKYRCAVCGYETNFLGARECKPLLVKNEPNLFKKIGNFTYAFAQHLYKGMPTVNEKQLNERLVICKECPLFKAQEGLVKGTCTHESCGCTIQDEIVFLNKIAWKDQFCPIGKWSAIEDGLKGPNLEENHQKSV